MAVEVVFETHASNVDNDRGRVSGWRPGRLSARGRELAAELGLRRGADNLAAVFCSDLAHAVETAELAFPAPRSVPVFFDHRLRECNYGQLNGAPAADVHAQRRAHLHQSHPDGESWTTAVERNTTLLRELPARYDGQRVLIIGHVATRWALDVLVRGAELDELIDSDFGWRPGWSYTLATESDPGGCRGGDEMPWPEVAVVLDALDAAGCRWWVEGGWGVDALVGKPTRTHRDLDIDLQADDVPAALAVLVDLGYQIDTDWRPHRVELVAGGRGRVDLHPLQIETDGRARQAALDGGFHEFPASCFTAGRLHGRLVPCVSIEAQIAFHDGYPPRPVDLHDLEQLAQLQTDQDAVNAESGVRRSPQLPGILIPGTSVASRWSVYGRSWRGWFRRPWSR